MTRPTPLHTQAELRLKDNGPAIYAALWSDSDAVVVSASYSTVDEVLGLDGSVALTGFDDDGCKLVRVPARHVKEWHTDEDAVNLFAIYDADQHLLACAR